MRLDPANPKDAAILAKIKDRSGKSALEIARESGAKHARAQLAKFEKAGLSSGGKQSRPKLKEPAFVRDDRVMMITLDYPLSVNHLYTPHPTKGIVLTAAGRQWKRDAQIAAQQQGVFLLTGLVTLTARVYRPIKRGDLTNRVKIAEDALTGICYYDDEQVSEVHLYRRLDRKNPRIEIEIAQIRAESV